MSRQLVPLVNICVSVKPWSRLMFNSIDSHSVQKRLASSKPGSFLDLYLTNTIKALTAV